MRTRLLRYVGVALGCALGLSLSYLPTAQASRSSGGTYSLPNTGSAPNPVVTGTTITSTWANTTLSDIASEVTNSLDRNGRGAMLAPLQCSAGTSTQPSLTFAGDTSSGLYRAGAGDIRFQVTSTNVQRWSATGVTFPQAVAANSTLVVSGTTSTSGGITATQSTTNGSAITATGNGTGNGVLGTGGTGGGTGLRGAGGPGGIGVFGIGGTATGIGVVGLGQGTGVGGTFAGGTAATASARTNALTVTNGDIAFTGVANPSPDAGVANTLTPKNFVKAWAHVTYDCAGNVSIADGYNVSACSISTTVINCTLVAAMSSTAAAVVAQDDLSSTNLNLARAELSTTSNVRIRSWYVYTSPPQLIDFTSCTAGGVSFVVVGAQ